MKLADKYLFEALDNYPYDLPQAIESLNYALAHDEENPLAHCLQGQIYAEQLKDYTSALECYETALSYDLYALKVHYPYIETLIWNDDFDKAEKFIGFALKVKGADTGSLYRQLALVWEYQGDYVKAKETLKLAKKQSYNECFTMTLKEDLERVKSKMTKTKKKVKTKKKRKKKKK